MLENEKIDLSCNYSKLQFAKLTEFFENELDESYKKDKYIVMLDIAYILRFMESIHNIDEHSNFKDSELDNLTITRIVYGILNTAAHYRHFINDKVGCKSVLIIYSSDSTIYDRYSITCSKVCSIVNLFKKTIFIEKLDNEMKYLYQHVAYFTATNIASMNAKIGKRCRIMYIGNNMLAMQMLRIDRDMIHVKHDYINHGPDIFFGSSGLKLDTVIDNYKDLDLISVLLCILGFKHGFPKLESLKHVRSTKIYNILIQNTMEFTDKNDIPSLVDGIKINQKDIDLLGIRLKVIDVDYMNRLYVLSKDLMKIWESKIDTKAVHSFNDFFVFEDLLLNVNWLMG